ncbi:DUF4124 domain-containing protein [Inmirania thermothiophila]|uniref:Uncharacterized protein DUF4124 n=1 Tax=Inmirania thermothiophila TaxID=1750597 RepID=A0A3N1Y6L8_9GAMM|nr:DUF4124 domain-containing protein [Inmirania thermothiophila]ROR34191.1 uncharacterized protein DUF4124 [Inmirania thermothiophila]
MRGSGGIVLALVLGLAGPHALAAVYKWTDAEGRVHYSDRPAPGAEAVRLDPLSTFRAPAPARRPPTPPAPQAAEGYRRVVIAAPEPEATIRDNEGRITVVVNLEPALREGHAVQILVDDRPQGAPARVTQFTLTNVDRGTHRIGARVLDGEGREVARAEPVTVYLHRESALLRRAAPGAS